MVDVRSPSVSLHNRDLQQIANFFSWQPNFLGGRASRTTVVGVANERVPNWAESSPPRSRCPTVALGDAVPCCETGRGTVWLTAAFLKYNYVYLCIFRNWFIKRHKVVTPEAPFLSEIISGTHCTYPRRDDQAEWTLGGLNKNRDCRPAKGCHQSQY